jgi:hypothetical protein
MTPVSKLVCVCVGVCFLCMCVFICMYVCVCEIETLKS